MSLQNFASTKDLAIGPASSGYESLAYDFEWNGKGNSPSSDSDANGVPNLLEYALGGNPLVPDPGILPRVFLKNQGPQRRLAISFLRACAQVVYTVEGSSKLLKWVPIDYEPVSVGQTQTVEDPTRRVCLCPSASSD